MTYAGTVQGGIIVLEAGVRLSEGTRVRVEPITNHWPTPNADTDADIDADIDDLARMGELAVETGIPDLGTNIDHYLYGHPKVTDAK